MPLLTVIIPAYNEAQTIGRLLDKVQSVDLEKEVIVVDDASSDGTVDIVSRSDITRLLRHKKNRGKGAAVRTGLAHAAGDIIIIQDADLEYEPNDYHALVAPIVNGEADVVYGSRILGRKTGIVEDYSSMAYYIGGRFLTGLTNLLYGGNITDESTCYKVFKKGILDKLTIDSSGFEFCPEITAKVLRNGFRVTEIPIHYYPRSFKDGKKIRWTDGLNAIFTLLKYRFRK